jgi:transposase
MNDIGLGQMLLAAARHRPDRGAISVGGNRLSYRELFEQAGAMAALLSQAGVQPGQLVAIFANRTITAYSAILAALMASCAYVPSNPAFSLERNRLILRGSGGRAIILGDDCASGLSELLDGIAAQLVKPYVKRGKNDTADAEALCEAMSRPTMRFVPVKTAEQQAALMMVGLRDRLIRNRTQLSNAIRGYAAEFGFTAAKGMAHIDPLLDRIQADERVPVLARELFAAQTEEYAQLQAQIDKVDAKLMPWHKADECRRRLAKIPGVGPIRATLLLMKTPAPEMFLSGRQFAAWIGLTPKDQSPAGKVRPGVITRAGDEALRSVLVVGAIAVIQHVRRGGRGSPWIVDLLKRKPPKLAAVALANKVARIAWKLMITGDSYAAKSGGAALMGAA